MPRGLLRRSSEGAFLGKASELTRHLLSEINKAKRERSVPGEEHVHRTLCEKDPGVFEDSGAANGAKV